MSRIIEPVHTAAVGLGNIRFFKSLLPGAHLIWFAYEDILKAAGLARHMRRHFEAMLKQDHRDIIKPVMTPDGPATLAPHYIAQGFVDAMEEIGRMPAGFASAYTHGAVAAMSVITGDLGLSGTEAMNYVIAAFRNSNGIEGPHPTIEASS
ncbi:MAG: hypothetical protein J0J10_17965 [Bosea sp.]|uniref:hypothetical protein n=1 Tax=Bosea sp. (in: a-proteobacteria) TaxID=1871050 RepID=UPI001ACF60F9|nr:hypothetical protein [Bosea sp. (in: a-proteobacteria)]MBN9470655.1 hypothetical protein [Bosea sp. (in: a-proteobacteria)]